VRSTDGSWSEIQGVRRVVKQFPVSVLHTRNGTHFSVTGHFEAHKLIGRSL
jgi:hypothetical protein